MSRLPTKDECIELLKKYGANEKVIAHSLKVAELSEFLAQKLIEKKAKLNLNLVYTGALLHDIDKIKTAKNPAMHGREGYDMLTKEGYLNVAGITIKHTLKSLINGDITQIEELIVNYADRRVIESKVVSLEERFKYLKEKNKIVTEQMVKACLDAEKALFSKLDIKPDDLLQLNKQE